MKILLIFIALFFFNFTQNSIYATVYNEIKEIEPINEVQEKIFLENETVKNDSFLKEKELSEENTTITENSDSNEVENNDALKIEVENENLLDSQKANVPENVESISSKNETEEMPTIILKNVETNKNISASEKTAEDLKITKRETLKNEDRFEEISDRTNRVTALGSAMGAIDLGNTPTKKIRVGAGVGNASSTQAVAVGVGYAPTERFKVNTKFSTSTNNFFNNSISVGASYDLDI